MNLAKVPQPKKGYIVVKPLKKDEEKTESGIIIPDTVEGMGFFRKAEVVAVGADTANYTMETKVTDRILVNAKLMELTDYTISVLGEKMFIIREESGFYGWVK